MYNNQIKLTKSNFPNPSLYIFPFKSAPIFDFSDRRKIKSFQQGGNNELSSEDEKTDDSLNLEKTLSKFYDYSLDCYKKNMYENLIKEIELNEYLYYVGSRESFDILILKIKCFMKLMIEEYENDLKNKIEIPISVKEYILRIENEFSNISKIINKKDSYEYETITQLFCKFLIYLIRFAQKREEFCKSMAFITLGINMMKIFFVKKKLTTEIKPYKRYIYLLLLLINQLIGEKNFKQALIYCNNLLKINEKVIKIIYKVKLKQKDKLRKKNLDKSIIEIFRCIGCTYLYIGICFETQQNSETTMEAYRQAFYFFMKIKHPIFYDVRKNNKKCDYDNNLLKISHSLFNNQKIKIEDEKRRRKENKNINEVVTKKKEQKHEVLEKKKKLKLVSSGLYGDQNKYNQIEKTIYKNILTPKNQKLISKLDKVLMSLAYSEKKSQTKKDHIKNNLSLNIMDNLCHYHLYDKLMSKNYHEFIMTNNNLKISNPRDQEDFISSINSYLTSTMEIKPQTDKKNKTIDLTNNAPREETIKNSLSSERVANKNGKISSAKIHRNLSMNLNNILESPQKTQKIVPYNKKSKIFLSNKNNSFLSLKLDITKINSNKYNNSRKINKSLSETYITSRTTNLLNSKSKSKVKSKKRIKSYREFKQSSSLKKNNNKHYLSPKYFNKYMYLDKLTKKEIDFQKVILRLKSSNSKYYYNDFLNEIYINEKNKEEETNRNYLLISEKISEKFLKNQKEYEKMINNHELRKQESKSYKLLLKLNKGKNLFRRQQTGTNFEFDLFDSIKMNTKNLFSEEDIKKMNEKSLFSLDEKIKNIRNKINEKKEKLKYH